MFSISVMLSHIVLWIRAALPQTGSNGMWRTKVQVFSEDLSVHVALEASVVGSGMFSAKPSCVLGRRGLPSLEGAGRKSRRHSVRGG